MSNNYYVAAFDPSLNSFGLAIIRITEDKSKNKIDVIECTHIPNGHFTSNQYGLKLNNIEMRLLHIRKVYNPKVVLREDMANSPSHEQVRKLGAVQALIDKVFFDYTIVGYSPTRIKKAITGDGKGDKLAVQNSLTHWYHNQVWKTDDESDALAIATTWLIEHGILEGKK